MLGTLICLAWNRIKYKQGKCEGDKQVKTMGLVWSSVTKSCIKYVYIKEIVLLLIYVILKNIRKEKGEILCINIYIVLFYHVNQVNGWQLAKMKQSIPDMSLP